MNKIGLQFKEESGSAIVIALLILTLLMIIGHMATRTTQIELLMAGNDTRHKENFYVADGMTELGTELLEQNIGCVNGFQNGRNVNGANIIWVDTGSLDFWTNNIDDATPPSDTNRDFVILTDPPANYPLPLANDYAGSAPHINVKLGGTARFASGAAMQIAAGYEGRGKALAAGGAFLAYDATFQHLGRMNTESVVWLQWRHIFGSERDCIY